MSSWFDTISAQVGKLAQDINTAADDLVSKANAAHAEILEEQSKIQASQVSSDEILMPWETTDADRSILSQDLMERIFLLPLSERNFTETPGSTAVASVEFDFNTYVPIIMKMLEIDKNLANVNAKVLTHFCHPLVPFLSLMVFTLPHSLRRLLP